MLLQSKEFRMEECQFIGNLISMQGISRSSSFVIAYLIYKFKVTLNEALIFLKKRHSDTNPNAGFIKQLAIYSQMINSSKNEKFSLTPRMDPPKNIDITN